MGYDHADDAAVFRLDDERALVQTLDFLTPVVDDPYTYGAIAAANSLSDVYAMGGKPITAMAITCFPDKGVDLAILEAIMRGGAEKLHEAEVVLVGGHSVADNEIKFGYSVTGLVHPKRYLANSGARPGDELVLSKPLGIGILTSGIKFQKTSPASAAQAIQLMTTLNRKASEIMLRYECHAATDITGNGFLGHAFEVAHASQVTMVFESRKIPYIVEAYKLAESGVLPRTIKSTWSMIQAQTQVHPSVPEPLRNILLDPQTSGGLLISLNSKDLPDILREMKAEAIEATHVGRVTNYEGCHLVVR